MEHSSIRAQMKVSFLYSRNLAFSIAYKSFLSSLPSYLSASLPPFILSSFVPSFFPFL